LFGPKKIDLKKVLNLTKGLAVEPTRSYCGAVVGSTAFPTLSMRLLDTLLLYAGQDSLALKITEDVEL